MVRAVRIEAGIYGIKSIGSGLRDGRTCREGKTRQGRGGWWPRSESKTEAARAATGVPRAAPASRRSPYVYGVYHYSPAPTLEYAALRRSTTNVQA